MLEYRFSTICLFRVRDLDPFCSRDRATYTVYNYRAKTRNRTDARASSAASGYFRAETRAPNCVSIARQVVSCCRAAAVKVRRATLGRKLRNQRLCSSRYCRRRRCRCYCCTVPRATHSAAYRANVRRITRNTTTSVWYASTIPPRRRSKAEADFGLHTRSDDEDGSAT